MFSVVWLQELLLQFSFNSHFESSNLCFFLLQMYIFVSQIIGNRANTNNLPFQKLI